MVGLAFRTNVHEIPTANEWDDRGMRLPLPAGGYLDITWPAHVDISLPGDPTAECLIQPHLSTAAGAIAMRSGQQPFHAGAFIYEGRTWGILGERNAGKSSTLAVASEMGLPVLTDDLLVIDNGIALAGPRCIDLRVGAAEALGIGVNLGTIGLRERWRVYLGHCPLEAPVGGWILPQWGEPEIRKMPPTGRFQTLLAHSFLQGITMNDPAQYLALSSLPLLSWERPKNWDLAEQTFLDLLERIITL
jgi:hypothetical protein